MPPKFSLQTVLDVRHSKVEALEIELGQIQQEKLQKENYLHTLYLAQDKLYESLHQSMSGDSGSGSGEFVTSQYQSDQCSNSGNQPG